MINRFATTSLGKNMTSAGGYFYYLCVGIVGGFMGIFFLIPAVDVSPWFAIYHAVWIALLLIGARVSFSPIGRTSRRSYDVVWQYFNKLTDMERKSLMPADTDTMVISANDHQVNYEVERLMEEIIRGRVNYKHNYFLQEIADATSAVRIGNQTMKEMM